MKTLPNIERLRELVSYNPETGAMTYLTASGYRGCKKAGRPVKAVDKDGYITGTLDGVRYFMHRVAYALHHGSEPMMLIDHINGDKSDNRISNLRQVDCKTNNENQRLDSAVRNRSTGLLGVQMPKGRKKFVAHLKVKGKTTYLGVFTSAEDARAAYVCARREHYQGNTL